MSSKPCPTGTLNDGLSGRPGEGLLTLPAVLLRQLRKSAFESSRVFVLFFAIGRYCGNGMNARRRPRSTTAFDITPGVELALRCVEKPAPPVRRHAADAPEAALAMRQRGA